MVSSLARILSSGDVHVSLLAVSATERVCLVVTLILCRQKSFINEFQGRTQDFRRGGGGCRDPPKKLTSQTSARLS